MNPLFLFTYFNEHCGWIYNNTSVLRWMFAEGEMEVPFCILKTCFISLWMFLLLVIPLIFIIRSFGIIIGSWTGMLKGYFIDGKEN